MADAKTAKKPMREEKVKFALFTQQLDPDYFDWARKDSERRADDGTVIDNRLGLTLAQARDLIEKGTAAEIAAYIVKRLEHVGDVFGVSDMDERHPGAVVVSCWAIIHDRDEIEVWDDARGDYVKVPKERHIHIIVVFEGDTRATYKSGTVGYLAKRAGIPANQVEKPKRGGNSPRVEAFGGTISQSLDNNLSYLTHLKYTEKFQYAPTDVATVRGPDFGAIYRERYADWIKGRAHVVKKRAAENVEDLRSKVLDGLVSKTQILLTDDLYEIYARNARVIDDALDAYAQRRAMRAAVKLQRGDFSTSVVYIHGASGIGKTRFATDFIDQAIGYAASLGQRWELYRAATGNPLDDWRGEEVVLLDDLRASAMDANDWLLLLDPFNASPARARYRNKQAVAPRLIVITATIEPVEFFFFARKRGEVDEALDQFIRRLASIVKVYRDDDILRYSVQRTGRVEPYQRAIQTGKDWRGQPEYERVALTYGAVHEIEHSAEGTVASLMFDLADRSQDVPFTSGAGWLALEDLAQSEAAEQHQAGGGDVD